MLAVSLIGGWYIWDYDVYMRSPMPISEEGLRYDVRAGASIRSIASDLARLGVLKKPRYFEISARLSGQATRIQYGEYAIESGITPERLLDQFVTGKVLQYSLTLVEGWNFKQVVEAIAQSPAILKDTQDLSPARIMARLGSEGDHYEGQFFPDTYYFPRGISGIEFLRRARRLMQKTLTEEWTDRAKGLPYKNSNEALIMASIIEKETSVPGERSQIAGVFVRRLQKKMRLQTDPTVIYGMGDAYKGNIRRSDLQRDTPYNTYTRKGLPPTPIAMPGRDSIRAALHPEPGDTLYFVAKGDGSHQFSVTFEEHDAAVTRYQRRRKTRR